jgi:hypothetical protein
MTDTKRTAIDNLDHSPVTAPRSGFRGEQVFTRLWIDLMNGPANEYNDDSPLGCVLSHYRFNITQREATVAASVIGWLGCNCGQATLTNAHRLTETSIYSRAEAYQMAWMHHNRRRVYHNSGMRALEHIMEVADEPNMARLTAEDHEVADLVWYWLGTDEGQAFLSSCENALIQRAEAPGVLPRQLSSLH